MFGVQNISFMISRSHFDSRLVGFKVWCHYSEGVRKKMQTSSSARGEVEKETGVQEREKAEDVTMVLTVWLLVRHGVSWYFQVLTQIENRCLFAGGGVPPTKMLKWYYISEVPLFSCGLFLKNLGHPSHDHLKDH